MVLTTDRNTTSAAGERPANGKWWTNSFTDDRGNRFIFPGLIVRPSDPKSISGSDVILRSMSLSCVLGVTLDKDRIEIDPDNFPHVESDAGHPGFAHGGATVWLFDGPVFDKIANQPAYGTSAAQSNPSNCV